MSRSTGPEPVGVRVYESYLAAKGDNGLGGSTKPGASKATCLHHHLDDSGSASPEGSCARVKKGKAYIYTAVLSLVESGDVALHALIQFYFEGSPEKLINHLTSEGQRSETPSSLPRVKSPVTNSPELKDCLL